ncbi:MULTISPECIES: DnaJ domain-containing protein [Modicisalibacter]|uniref:DnaJ domain-containing protein n=1 Tax=Modicisalibacter TaxID=574347 RepID=UPI00100AC92C|nr:MULTISPECIES: DnaJ domain-containing protein [Halomonadaceae]MBZ9557701.1 DnaJ domain-containing protein [Modicisalibacter sp. R2A 31.J]MBZ9573635.1 DnaJ domain-containing protein [Modicisalibacter sp. MOD 31.J]
MAPAPFSPFELLLLKSRNQTDTAALLMLAWVMASKGSVLPEDRHYLDTLAARFRHGHALQPLIEIAAAQDLTALQLAAEVLQKDLWREQAHPFLSQAIGLATSDGPPSSANNHVLRFLADLLGVSPPTFAALFKEVAGRALPAPADPSHADYWQAREQTRHRHDSYSGQGAHAGAERETPEPDEATPRQARESWRERRARRREQARERERQAREAAERRAREQRRREQEQAREQREREERRERERQERERREREEEYARAHRERPAYGDPASRALRVLGLEDGASRQDIKKAYRRLAQAHHPDRVFSQGEQRMATASLRFQRIQQAYEILMQDARFV